MDANARKALDALSSDGHGLIISEAGLTCALGVQLESRNPPKEKIKNPALLKYFQDKKYAQEIQYSTPEDLITSGVLDGHAVPKGIIVVRMSDKGEQSAETATSGIRTMEDYEVSETLRRVCADFKLRGEGIRIPVISLRNHIRPIVDEIYFDFDRDPDHSSAFSLNAAIFGLHKAKVFTREECEELLRKLNPSHDVKKLIQGMPTTGPTRFCAAFSNTTPSKVERW